MAPEHATVFEELVNECLNGDCIVGYATAYYPSGKRKHAIIVTNLDHKDLVELDAETFSDVLRQFDGWLKEQRK